MAHAHVLYEYMLLCIQGLAQAHWSFHFTTHAARSPGAHYAHARGLSRLA